jgi:hypothetical protein
VNSASSQLLRDVPGSLRALALQVGEVGYPAMGAAVRMIQTGEPAFNLVFGAVWEEHLAIDPHARARFNRLVAARKELLADHLLDHRWTGRETVIDLGGGDGALLQGLLARRPRLRGVVFDLPDVVAEGPNDSARPGCEIAARRWPATSFGTSPRAATSISSPTARWSAAAISAASRECLGTVDVGPSLPAAAATVTELI